MLTLPTLTPQEITELLVNPRRNRKRAKYYGFDGNMEYVANPTAAQKGGFDGKTGTKRRSRKGAVTTLPNGKRFYVDGTLIAYRPGNVVK